MKAVLYARVSTPAQAARHGVAAQVASLNELARKNGWDVVATYADEAVSGRTTSRPQLDLLMEHVARGDVHVVAVWRFDRMARSVVHLCQLLTTFQKAKVDFVSVQEQIDTTTPLGRALFHVAALMAELEADIARERINAGLVAARKRGVKLGRPAALDVATVQRAVQEAGGIRGAARLLKVSHTTVMRTLRRVPS